MSDQWLLETIKAKSDQLNACDLVGGPITVTVQKVSKLAGEQPVSIEIGEGRQPFKPCKSMRRVLIACWGTERWVGRSMTLCCDTDVKFGGQKEKDGSPDELIDGERLADRIVRLKREIRAGVLKIERTTR